MAEDMKIIVSEGHHEEEVWKPKRLKFLMAMNDMMKGGEERQIMEPCTTV